MKNTTQQKTTAQAAKEELVSLFAHMATVGKLLYALPNSEKKATLVTVFNTLNEKIVTIFCDRFGTREELMYKAKQTRAFNTLELGKNLTHATISAIRHPITTTQRMYEMTQPVRQFITTKRDAGYENISAILQNINQIILNIVDSLF